MYGLECERRDAYGHVLGAIRFGCSVADPFSCRRACPSRHVENSAFILDSKHPPKHNRDLLELRTLSRLNPSRPANASGRHLHGRDHH
jgi:hypothetical protein